MASGAPLGTRLGPGQWMAIDAAVAVAWLVVLVGLAVSVHFHQSGGEPYARAVLLGPAASLPLAVRRRWSVPSPRRPWPADQDGGNPMTQDIPPDARDRARVLFGDLIEGRGEEVHQGLEPGLRGRVPADWFARARAKTVGSVGSFERMVALPARQSGGYTVVDVLLTFAAGDVLGEVVFDRDGKVAGLGLEHPYPRPRWPEPGKRQGGGAIRNPEVARLMRTRP